MEKICRKKKGNLAQTFERLLLHPLNQKTMSLKPTDQPARTKHPNRKLCATCSTKTITASHRRMYCGRCFTVAYCSTECQKKDWKKHCFSCKAWQKKQIGTSLASMLYQHTGFFTSDAIENEIFRRVFSYHVDRDLDAQLLRRQCKLFQNVVRPSSSTECFIVLVPRDFRTLPDAVGAWTSSNCTKSFEIHLSPGTHDICTEKLWIIGSGKLKIRGLLDAEQNRPTLKQVGVVKDEKQEKNHVSVRRPHTTYSSICIVSSSDLEHQHVEFVDLKFDNVRVEVEGEGGGGGGGIPLSSSSSSSKTMTNVSLLRCKKPCVVPSSLRKVTMTDCGFLEDELFNYYMPHFLHEPSTVWFDYLNYDDVAVVVEEGEEEEGPPLLDEPSTVPLVWFDHLNYDVTVEEEIVTKRQEKKLRRNQRAVQQLQVRRRQRATSFTLRRHHKHHAVRQYRSKGSFSSKY